MDTDRPNVLIITTHDSGRHFGCYGVDTGHSPAIDSLAGRRHPLHPLLLRQSGVQRQPRRDADRALPAEQRPDAVVLAAVELGA